jgi:hypothetical protein
VIQTHQGRRHDRPGKRRVLYGASLIWALLAAPAVAEDTDVYKWVDQNGVVHYSDVPVDENAVATGIRSERTDRRRVEEEQRREWDQRREDEQQQAEQAEQERQSASRTAQAAADEADRCATARERAERYTTAHRLFEPLPDGGRRYLTDEETTAARASAEAEVERWCQ